jgi:hypothetical protein
MMCRARCDERGIALLHVLMLLTIVTAIAAGAAMLARVEVAVSYFQRSEREAAYAAQAGLAATVQELDRVADWDAVLAGSRQAAFAAGSATTPRQVAGIGTVWICCAAGSLTARVQAETGQPWRPYGWQSVDALLALANAPRHFVVAWVMDDGEDVDGNPVADSNDRIAVRVESIRFPGVRKAVEVLVARAPFDPIAGTRAPGLGILVWRELR